MQAWQRQRSQELSSSFVKTLGQVGHTQGTLHCELASISLQLRQIQRKVGFLRLTLDRNAGLKWRKAFPLTPLVKFTQTFRVKSPAGAGKIFAQQCLLQPVKFSPEQIFQYHWSTYHWSSKGTPLSIPALPPSSQVSDEAPECTSPAHTLTKTELSWSKPKFYLETWPPSAPSPQASMVAHRGARQKGGEERQHGPTRCDTTRDPPASLLPLPHTPGEAAGASQSRGTSASSVLSENKLPAQHSPAAGKSSTWPSYAFPLPAGNSPPWKHPFAREIQILFAHLHPERSRERNQRFLQKPLWQFLLELFKRSQDRGLQIFALFMERTVHA